MILMQHPEDCIDVFYPTVRPSRSQFLPSYDYEHEWLNQTLCTCFQTLIIDNLIAGCRFVAGSVPLLRVGLQLTISGVLHRDTWAGDGRYAIQLGVFTNAEIHEFERGRGAMRHTCGTTCAPHPW